MQCSKHMTRKEKTNVFLSWNLYVKPERRENNKAWKKE